MMFRTSSLVNFVESWQLWAVPALFSYRRLSSNSVAKVALMAPFQGLIFNHMAKMARTLLLPDMLVEPDSPGAGPFPGRSQRAHPGSRVSRVSARCPAIQNCQHREPNNGDVTLPFTPHRCESSPRPCFISFSSKARVSRLWSPPAPSSKPPSNRRSAKHLDPYRWPGSRGGQRLWRPPRSLAGVTWALQLARLGCVTVPCYCWFPSSKAVGIGQWLGVAWVDLGLELGAWKAGSWWCTLSSLSHLRGGVFFLVSRQDDETLRAPRPSPGTVWPR